MNELLRVASRRHSEDMGSRDYFDHVTPDGVNPFQRIEAIGFTGAQPWGENLAGGSDTAQRAVAGLMDSPGHCRNIMNAAYQVAGMGYAFDANSPFRHYWTQKFAGGD